MSRRRSFALVTLAGCATVGPLPEQAPSDDGGVAMGDAGETSTGADQAAPPVDAAVDTRQADVTPIPDAPIEAPAPTWCDSVTPKPSFCADFDRGRPVDNGWTKLVLDPGATAQLGVVAKTTPFAFNAVTQAMPSDGQYLHALLVETLTAAAAGATLAFDAHFAKAYTIGPNTHLTYARMRFPVPAGATYHVEVGIYGGQGQLIETTVPAGGQPTYVMHACPFPAAATWVRVAIDVTLSAPANAKVTFDGSLQLDTAITPVSASAAPTAEVGLDVGGALESTNANFDDVTLTAK